MREVFWEDFARKNKKLISNKNQILNQMENFENQTEEDVFGQPVETKSAKSEFDKEKVINFYKKGLPEMLKTFFSEPISGTYSLLSANSNTGFFNSVLLIATAGILYMIIPYFMIPSYERGYVGFGFFFKCGLAIVALLMIISVISFLIKSLSGKPVFRNELLTGALCAIPVSFLIIFVFVSSFFVSVDNIMDFGAGSLQTLQRFGALGGLIILYLLLMMINILQQSLKAGNTKDALAWYLSPVGILLAFYITAKIVEMFIQ